MTALAENILEELVSEYPIGYRPPIVWRRMRVSAGRANFTRGTITLSSLLLVDEERVRATLVHEYAHLLAFHRHGRGGIGHGAAWRRAMIDLGAEPEVYHSYPVEHRRRERKHHYRCDRCGLIIGRVQPLKRGYRYSHRGCGGGLVRIMLL